MQVTATQAKNRFGALCAQAKVEPVFIEKDGRVDTVIVSIQQFEAMKSASQPRTLAQRQRQFEETYKAWIDEQKARFDKYGLWCDDFRVW
ncbi:type II toxin-antitoxin system Phd/YefM family antitoxin [Pseudorhodoferax sp. Leaf267]|uniref:type II toxin-antitoxin system Phd/YefM family antitoxin n=1 Tax=Pseudorhodoferax sp. Leaf267 TaxID=1736316 RepID=UPI000701879B|nr:type II toxin-antitoxin system Phd/YefM family antitoxin [Pseudorhodoferax sp. Leaf267]KQP13085.1 prevent-host-death protein [Pseudorhodoferax sp. Leaf267]